MAAANFPVNLMISRNIAGKWNSEQIYEHDGDNTIRMQLRVYLNQIGVNWI